MQLLAVVQDGGCKHGNVGRKIQQLETGRVRAQLQVLPVRMHRRLSYRTLPVAEADDVHVGQIADTGMASVLQHEMIKNGVGEHLESLRDKTLKRNKFCSHSIFLLYIL